jgi:hypothetical protein
MRHVVPQIMTEEEGLDGIGCHEIKGEEEEGEEFGN